VNSICLLKSALDIGFNDDGTQVLPVPARIGGRAEGLNALLKSCGWEAVMTITGNWWPLELVDQKRAGRVNATL
jgi:hypothetical protein